MSGYRSKSFPVERGFRQGDPISPYLFVIGSEMLNKMIQANPVIKGINIHGTEYRITQFAMKSFDMQSKRWRTKSFRLERGCRQGDPISPYLFVIGSEIWNKMIQANPVIKGINIHRTEYRITQFADDTEIFLKN